MGEFLKGAGRLTVAAVLGSLILHGVIKRADPVAQIVGAIVFSGCLIAAAVWFKKPGVVQVYGSDWRVRAPAPAEVTKASASGEGAPSSSA
ncbi:hypothetical protein M5E06_10385 [Azospirillum sp. A1-3]|uniref:hypothetical protein n=1 Tax=Azospirillum sp. A1-3 TaxID=185874 RepID=UPI0020774D8F|nr:hypothetical protein [Azospirillum sp. A1-3]MCM8734601.1 hypothetical protein [Azospirillum sp. A1-3]